MLFDVGKIIMFGRYLFSIFLLFSNMYNICLLSLTDSIFMDGAEANSFVKTHPRTKRGYKEECENEGCDAEEIEEIAEYVLRPVPIGGGGPR